VFSQSLATLDLMERFLATHFGYRKGAEYFRIDGSIAAGDRQQDIDEFNKPDHETKSRIFLVSTKAGSLGINLVGGNHVILMDASWNPATDLQATFRCYRFGQTKRVYIYRLIAADTIEQVIYERQISKRGMALRIVDEHQVDSLWQDDEFYNYEDSEDEQNHHTHHVHTHNNNNNNNNNNNIHMHTQPHALLHDTSSHNGMPPQMADNTDASGGFMDLTGADAKWTGDDFVFRDCIVLDSDDDANSAAPKMRQIKELVPSPLKKKKKNKRIKEVNKKKLYGKVVDLPPDSPLPWLCQKFSQGAQRKLAEDILLSRQLSADQASSSFASDVRPPAPGERGPRVSPPLPLRDNSGLGFGLLDGEFQTPMSDQSSSRHHRGSRHHTGSILPIGRAYEAPDHSWIKGLHMSKVLLQHRSGDELTSEEQRIAKESYKNSVVQEQEKVAIMQRSRQMHMAGDNGQNILLEQVKNWNVGHVLIWLKENKLAFLCTEFQRRNITGEVLLHISSEDLKALRVTPYHREQFLFLIHNNIIWRGSRALQAKGWEIHKNNGDVFFYNKYTKDSQWEKPLELLDELEAAGVSHEEVMQRLSEKQQQQEAADVHGHSFNDAIDLTG